MHGSETAAYTVRVAMNQQQRRRAQRLRLKRDGDAKRGIPPRPLMPKESTWLAWYDANVGPSPLRPKKSGTEAPELEPDAPDEDLEPEPDPPGDVLAEQLEPEELEQLELEQLEPEEPERERPRWIDARTLEGQRRRAELAPFVAKIHALECTNEALRSAVNVQIAGGQMLERACVIALDLAAEMKSERGGLVQQLVDTIAALAEVQQERVVEQQQQPTAAQSSKVDAKGVTDEIGRRMIDGIFPPAPVTTPPTPPPEPKS